MFDVLFHKNPYPVVIYDKENLKFIQVNNAAVKTYGYTLDEFLKLDFSDLYASEDIQSLLNVFNEKDLEESYVNRFRHKKKDGSTFLVSISKNSFNFNDRDVYISIINDITETIENEKQNRILHLFNNLSDIMVFGTDSEGFINSINNSVTEKLGFTLEELKLSSFASLAADNDRIEMNSALFKTNSNEIITYTTKIKNTSGVLIDVEINILTVLSFDGKKNSFMLAVKEIPAKTIDPISADSDGEMNKSIYAPIKFESEPQLVIPNPAFISQMFHEVLTHLNVIIGFSQDLVAGIEKPTEEQIDISEIINQNRLKMINTMNTFVEYSEIIQNSAELMIEDICITEIIDSLDNDTRFVPGINDIEFSYGKVSSSLKFKSDKRKFENFILYIIKIIAVLTKEHKVYVTAVPLDENSFMIAINDKYENNSKLFAETLNKIFNTDINPEELGLSTLTTYPAKVLLSVLRGKFVLNPDDLAEKDSGFIFPIDLSIKEQAIQTEDLSDDKPIEPENLIIENVSSESISLLEFKEHIDQLSLLDMFDGIEEVSFGSKIESQPEKQENNLLFDKHTNETDAIKNNDEIEKVKEVEVVYTFDEVTETDGYYFEEKFDSSMLGLKKKSEKKAGKEKKSTSEKKNKQQSTADKQDLKNFDQSVEQGINPNNSMRTKHVNKIDLSKLKCLCLDSHRESQLLFKSQMSELSDIKFALNFEEARSILNKNLFDFIVMDINLQVQSNGSTAIKIVKNIPAFKNILIIASTAFVLPGDKDRFISAGFDDFISKPILKEKLVESLEKIFTSKKS